MSYKGRTTCTIYNIYDSVWAMEYFYDVNNSPLLTFLPDFNDIKLRSYNSFEEAFNGKLESFFDDPECRRSVASLEKEDFILDFNQKDIGDFQVFDIERKIKKSKKNKPDYKKNICGYITKRIIREFISDRYQTELRQLCFQQNCDVQEVKSFFLSKIETITGPRHLQALLAPTIPSQHSFKKVFLIFFQWFLKERYVRYLLSDGKMTDKRTYIQYKNTMIIKYIKGAKQYYKDN